MTKIVFLDELAVERIYFKRIVSNLGNSEKRL